MAKLFKISPRLFQAWGSCTMSLECRPGPSSPSPGSCHLYAEVSALVSRQPHSLQFSRSLESDHSGLRKSIIMELGNLKLLLPQTTFYCILISQSIARVSTTDMLHWKMFFYLKNFFQIIWWCIIKFKISLKFNSALATDDGREVTSGDRNPKIVF